MKFSRPALMAGLACSILVAGHASAATPTVKKLVLTDPAGDANAANDQNLGLPVLGNGAVGPGSQPDKDILSVSYASTLTGKGKAAKCTGFTAALKLSAAPTSNTLYRLDGTGTVNASLWWLQYDGVTTKVRWSDGSSANPLGSGTAPLTKPAVVSGSTITFTVTEADLKASGEKLKSFVLSGPGSDVRSIVPGAGATVPQWDVLPASSSYFKPC